MCSHTSSGENDGTEAAENSEMEIGVENISAHDDDGAKIDYAGIEVLPGWSEMERYCIKFDEWIHKNMESKCITKLPKPGVAPSSRKDEVY